MLVVVPILCALYESRSTFQTSADLDIGGVCHTADLYDGGRSFVDLHQRSEHKAFAMVTDWLAQTSVLLPGNDNHAWSTADE